MALTLLFDKLKPAVKSKLNQGLRMIDYKTVKFLACLEVRICECLPQFELYHQIGVRIGECGPQFALE